MNKLNIFDLTSCFWRIAEEAPFSATEAALYFYLLNKANTQKWKMPIRSPTVAICLYLSTTKQNICKARTALQKRGLINFTAGTDKQHSALYTLLPTDSWPGGPLSAQFTDELTVQLTPYKNKECKTEDNSINACKKLCSLDQLRETMMSDAVWLQGTLSLLSKISNTELSLQKVKAYINDFFLYLQTSGYKEREDADCRKHFINWAKKRITKNNPNDEKIQSISNESNGNKTTISKDQSYYDAF